MADDSLVPEIDVFNLPVFADADLLPMLADDEMADMVESIKANGQREPITIAEVEAEDGQQWMLIDGRNRREACRLAEVEPKYRVFVGDETAIKAFILDTDNRRNTSRAQRSMRIAFVLPIDYEPDKGGKGKTSKLVQLCTSLTKRDKTDIFTSFFIRKHNEPLGRLILAGHPNYTLQKAYDEVKAVVDAQEKKEREENEKLAKISWLRENYPDLASLLDERRQELDELLETAEGRIRKAQQEADRIAFEAAEAERLAQEAEDARLAEVDRLALEKIKAERDDYERRVTGFFHQLNLFISSTSIAVNAPQIAQLDVYVANGEWGRFLEKYHHQKKDALSSIRAFAENLPTLIEKLEQM